MEITILFVTGVLLGCSASLGGPGGKVDAPHDPNAAVSPTIKASSYGFDLLDIGRAVGDKLSVQISATFQSKHIWHGFDLMDGHAVFFPVATATLGDTGLSAKIIGVYTLEGTLDERDELNGAVFYSRDFLQDTRCATHGTINYFYYGKPEMPSHRADAQELGLGLFWPRLLGDHGFVPNYYIGRLWPSESNSLLSGVSGFIHVFGLAYNLGIPHLRSDGQPQPFRISGDVTYNDGFGGAGHDWSHAALGASTNLQVGRVSITPAVNYQVPIGHLVNIESEFWAGVTFTYSF